MDNKTDSTFIDLPYGGAVGLLISDTYNARLGIVSVLADRVVESRAQYDLPKRIVDINENYKTRLSGIGLKPLAGEFWNLAVDLTKSLPVLHSNNLSGIPVVGVLKKVTPEQWDYAMLTVSRFSLAIQDAMPHLHVHFVPEVKLNSELTCGFDAPEVSAFNSCVLSQCANYGTSRQSSAPRFKVR